MTEQRVAWHTCTCGKRGYATRADAKRVIKVQIGYGQAHRTRPGAKLDAYRCDTNPDVFHIGHATEWLRRTSREGEAP